MGQGFDDFAWDTFFAWLYDFASLPIFLLFACLVVGGDWLMEL